MNVVECVANISSVFYSHLITVVALHLFHYTTRHSALLMWGQRGSGVMMLVELINTSMLLSTIMCVYFGLLL